MTIYNTFTAQYFSNSFMCFYVYFQVTDTEIFIEDDEFRFHSKPYFLRYGLNHII